MNISFVKRPMLLCSVICIIASILSFHFQNLIPLFATAATAVILVCVVFLGADRRLVIVLVAVLAVLFGAASFHKKANSFSELYGKEITATLTFCEDEQEHGDYYSARVKAEAEGIPDNVKLQAGYFGSLGYCRGDRIAAKIVITGMEDNSFYSGFLADGIFAYCDIEDVLRELTPERFGSMAGKIQKYVNKTLFENLSYECAATVNALVTGDRSYLSDEFYSAVKGAGVSHVMVVSGLHLSIIMGAVYTFISVFGKNRFLKSAVSVLTVLFVSAICGFTMSIMRAGLMFIIAAVAPLIDRDSDALSNLGTAVVLILLHSPFAVFSVALQLSLLSTYGILVLTPEIMKLVQRKVSNRIILGFINMLSVTLSASFMTFPVAVYRFGYISLTAPLANILITHAVSAALISAVLGLVINPVPVISDWIFIFCDIVVKYINQVIWLFGGEDSAVSVGRWVILPSVFLIMLVLFLIRYCKYKENLLKLREELK